VEQIIHQKHNSKILNHAATTKYSSPTRATVLAGGFHRSAKDYGGILLLVNEKTAAAAGSNNSG
jgi:hypothetical protein